MNKFNIPSNPYEKLSHEFSEIKYINITNADFRGYPPNLNDEYTESIFDYE